MTCWAIIPVKATEDSKSRLAGVLDAEERQALVSAMLNHVVDAAQSANRISRVVLVGPSRCGLPEEIPLLEDPGEGLNMAVQSAFREVAGNKPDRVLVIAADLPVVSSQELDLLTVVPENAVGIAPDRHETGTNALSLPLPAAQDFAFSFGPDSFAKHKQETARLGLELETILSKGLERDIDAPEDLADAKAVLKTS